MIKKTLILLTITCFFAQSTGVSYALRPKATAVQTEEQKTAYYTIAPSILKASGLPEPQRQTLSKFARQSENEFSPLQMGIKKRLIAITIAIEATLGISKYLGILPVVVGLTAGCPLLGSIIGGACFLSTGICRLSTFVAFKYMYPAIPIRKSFYIMTLLPFTIGFIYTLAYLYFPSYSLRDIKKLKDIIYKIESVFYRSSFQKNSPIDFKSLISNKYLIADDILRYQKSHFGLFDSRYRKFFRIRSARWTAKQESRMYTHLHQKKRFLFTDSQKLIEKLAVVFREQYGHSHLKRIYYYDVPEFLSDISKIPLETSPPEKKKKLKETYIKHLFPEYEINGIQLTDVNLWVEDIEMAILQALHDNSDNAFTLAAIQESLKFDINDEDLHRIIEVLCAEDLIRKIYIQHKAPQQDTISSELGLENKSHQHNTVKAVRKGLSRSIDFIQNTTILTTIASAA